MIVLRLLVHKKLNTYAFTISCIFGESNFVKTSCNLRACINLMPLATYKKLGLETPKLASMRLLMADFSIKNIGQPLSSKTIYRGDTSVRAERVVGPS